MDVMKYEILEDGTLSIETDAVSGKNHHSADEFMRMVTQTMGGSCKIHFKQGHAIAHAHHHDHEHDHHHH